MQYRVERDGNSLMVMRGIEILCYCGDADMEQTQEYADEVCNALNIVADKEVIVAAVYTLGWWLTDGLFDDESVAVSSRCYGQLEKLQLNSGHKAKQLSMLQRLRDVAGELGVKL